VVYIVTNVWKNFLSQYSNINVNFHNSEGLKCHSTVFAKIQLAEYFVKVELEIKVVPRNSLNSVRKCVHICSEIFSKVVKSA
jgi:hypothetical protein